MPRELDFTLDWLNRLNAIREEWRIHPLTLGGSSGSNGGSTGAIGGVEGQLSQRDVSGDTSESFLFTSGSISNLVDNLNNIRAWEQPTHGFWASTGSPPTNYLTISSGSWYYSDSTKPLIYTGGNTPTLSAPSSGSRYDLLIINTAGTLGWIHGTQGATPVEPTWPTQSSGSLPLWEVLSRSTGSVIQRYDDNLSHYLFRDERPFLSSIGTGSSGSTVEGLANRIPYFTGPNTLQSSGSLNWIQANGQLVVGAGAASPVSTTSGIHIVQDGTGGALVFTAFQQGNTANIPFMAFLGARGSLGVPTASQSGDVIGRITGRGYGTSAFAAASKARIDMTATENWSDAAQGTSVTIYTTPATTNTIAQKALFDDSGFTLSTGSIVMSPAISNIVPGATQLDIRNNANTASNLSVVDAGTATFRGPVLVNTANTGGKLSISGGDFQMFTQIGASAASYGFSFKKSRGTEASPLIVASGDTTGFFAGLGYDGSTYRQNAYVAFRVDATPGASDMPGRIDFATTLDGAASPTINMTLDNTGALKLVKTITLYSNVATEGYGIGAIVDNVALTAQGADIGTTNFTNAATAGEYAVYYYLVTSTTGGAATMYTTIGWNDGVQAQTFNSGTINLSGIGSRTTGVIYVRLGSGNVTYATTASGAYSGAKYALYFSCVRMN